MVTVKAGVALSQRADASTVWKEFTASDGRKYYFNKITQQSTWTIPEELKLAREQAQKTISQGMVSNASDTSNAAASSAATPTPANAANSNTLTSNGLASSPSSITPIIATDHQRLVSGLSGTPVSNSVVTSNTTGVEPSTVVTVSTAPTTVTGSSGIAANSLDSKIPSIAENQATHDSTSSVNGAPLQDVEVNSHWRKIQDRLEDDDRHLLLEKIDRLLVYQDYIRDLEKEEEEQKRIQKERLRRGERKNRDAFRKLLEEHIADGVLTAKTQWRDYCLKVKELPQYQAVASNTSGSTPRDLYEDVFEDLEKKYHEDKTLIKDTLKSGKITVVTTSVYEDFKSAVLEEAACQTISEINLKLLYEELLERAREKEEKEAKKRQRLADDFTNLLYSLKDITTTSIWEDCKPLFEETQEYKSVGDESYSREIFEEYIAYLKEKVKEKERKREEEKAKKEKEREEKEKRKEKEKKEKERDREKEKSKERHKKDDTDSDNPDISDSHGYREEKKKEKDKDKERKHRRRHQSSLEDVDSEKDEKEESRKSRRHGSDRKKSRKHANSPESDNETRHKKHKREHGDGSRRTGWNEELEDGELGDDGEV